MSADPPLNFASFSAANNTPETKKNTTTTSLPPKQDTHTPSSDQDIEPWAAELLAAQKDTMTRIEAMCDMIRARLYFDPEPELEAWRCAKTLARAGGGEEVQEVVEEVGQEGDHVDESVAERLSGLTESAGGRASESGVGSVGKMSVAADVFAGISFSGISAEAKPGYGAREEPEYATST